MPRRPSKPLDVSPAYRIGGFHDWEAGDQETIRERLSRLRFLPDELKREWRPGGPLLDPGSVVNLLFNGLAVAIADFEQERRELKDLPRQRKEWCRVRKHLQEIVRRWRLVGDKGEEERAKERLRIHEANKPHLSRTHEKEALDNLMLQIRAQLQRHTTHHGDAEWEKTAEILGHFYAHVEPKSLKRRFERMSKDMRES